MLNSLLENITENTTEEYKEENKEPWKSHFHRLSMFISAYEYSNNSLYIYVHIDPRYFIYGIIQTNILLAILVF